MNLKKGENMKHAPNENQVKSCVESLLGELMRNAKVSIKIAQATSILH